MFRWWCCHFPFLALSYVAQLFISLLVVSWGDAGAVRYWGPYCHGWAGLASVTGGSEAPDVVAVRAPDICIVGGCLRCYDILATLLAFLPAFRRAKWRRLCCASPVLWADQTSQTQTSICRPLMLAL